MIEGMTLIQSTFKFLDHNPDKNKIRNSSKINYQDSFLMGK